MKSLSLTILLLIVCQLSYAQAKIEFAQTKHNYDTIAQGSDGQCTFTFRNTGDKPLIITRASASCGCTTPQYDKRPVLPGQTGKIRVRYNTELVGQFRKTIVVKSNAENNPLSVLTIQGVVERKKGQSKQR